jgi:hypothetical protein
MKAMCHDGHSISCSSLTKLPSHNGSLYRFDELVDKLVDKLTTRHLGISGHTIPVILDLGGSPQMALS